MDRSSCRTITLSLTSQMRLPRILESTRLFLFSENSCRRTRTHHSHRTSMASCPSDSFCCVHPDRLMKRNVCAPCLILFPPIHKAEGRAQTLESCWPGTTCSCAKQRINNNNNSSSRTLFFSIGQGMVSNNQLPTLPGFSIFDVQNSPALAPIGIGIGDTISIISN